MAAEVAMSKISVETLGNPRLAGKSMLKPKYNARATFAAVYCGPVLRHSAEPIQAANFRLAITF